MLPFTLPIRTALKLFDVDWFFKLKSRPRSKRRFYQHSRQPSNWTLVQRVLLEITEPVFAHVGVYPPGAGAVDCNLSAAFGPSDSTIFSKRGSLPSVPKSWMRQSASLQIGPSLTSSAGVSDPSAFHRSAYSRRAFLTRRKGLGCDLFRIALDSMNARFLYEQGSI